MLERAWRYYKHADDLVAGRINFFLVAESMLIVSFVTLENKIFLQTCIALLGIFFTFAWFYVNGRLSLRMESLDKNYLRKLDPLYVKYIKSTENNKFFNMVSSRVVLNCILPLVTIFFWVVLFFYTFYTYQEVQVDSMKGAYKIYGSISSAFLILFGTYLLSRNIFRKNIVRLFNFRGQEAHLPRLMQFIVFIFGYQKAFKNGELWKTEHYPTYYNFSLREKIRIIEPFLGFAFILVGTIISLVICYIK
ncbi:MAG: hypothetical protein JXB42_11900 [Deltaproteobacteria bacterium]|nr:hypothetical protein [Deltaproteobacteria bacterium]